MSLRRDERGSVTIWIATASFVMMTMVGLAVGLGGQVHAQQRAHDLAAEAARTGAEQVQAAPAIEGRYVAIDVNAARAAAQRYLGAAGVRGEVSVSDGDTLTVTVSDTYTPRFLGFLDIGPLPVSGTASARLVRTIGGTEQ